MSGLTQLHFGISLYNYYMLIPKNESSITKKIKIFQHFSSKLLILVDYGA